MKARKNQDIRNMAKENNLYLWQIAEKMGICDMTLSRKLRKELSQEEKQEVFSIINELKVELDNE